MLDLRDTTFSHGRKRGKREKEREVFFLQGTRFMKGLNASKFFLTPDNILMEKKVSPPGISPPPLPLVQLSLKGEKRRGNKSPKNLPP